MVERYSFKGVGNGSSNTGFWSYLASIVTKLKSMYDFVKVEEADYGMPGESSNKEYAKFYITNTCGFSLYGVDNWTFAIKLFSQDKSSIIFSDKNNSWETAGYYFNITTTNNGLAFNYNSVSNNGTNTIPSDRYVLYVGDVINLDGSASKGCIGVDDSGNLTIATDNGISSEKPQTSTINADRTAILTPVVDTTYGNVFKDIYFMRSSPLNYNIMAVEGQGNFLCGKTLCLKD